MVEGDGVLENWGNGANRPRSTNNSNFPTPHRQSSASLDLQESAVASESGAKRRHPPTAAGSGARERALQHEKTEGSAEVAKLTQPRRAPSKVNFSQPEPILHRHQHVASARVHDP